MKIALATPLYPPEIGGPATYIKELSERLRDDHEITIIAYATTSERIPGTKLVTVSKRRPLPIRLLKFTWELFKVARHTDVIYVQNAVAAGFPAALVHLVTRVPVVLKFVGDESWERATQLKQTTKRLEEFLENPEGSCKIRLIGFLQGWVLRHVSVVTTPSVYLTEAIIKTYRVPRSRAVVNYNAAEKNRRSTF
jgi:glycosyltransferase involved in cell wall biosynthesis